MYRNLLLAFDFAKRDFKERYVGTGLGQLWYILSPVITIFIYTVIFSDFMKMKLNIIESEYSYSIYIVPGILSWTAFSMIVIRLTTSFESKINMIKKINVPMYVFQLAIVMTESFTFFISICLGIVFLLFIHHTVNTVFLYIFPVMFLQIVFSFSLGVIFSLFTPFLKDLKEAVPIMFQLWFWMTPIVYMKEMIESKYPYILTFNPIYYYIRIYQDIFLFSKVPSAGDLIIITLIAVSSLFLAGYLYKKLINTIKDII